MKMAKVHNLFRAPKVRLPMEKLQQVSLLADFGAEGCAHARPGSKRQVLIVDRETLEAMDLRPGMLRENITTEGLNVNGLPIGQQLRVGAARLEVSMVCTPCDQMERIRPGLWKELWGRRGMLCCVLEGGLIRPGDAIENFLNNCCGTTSCPSTDPQREMPETGKNTQSQVVRVVTAWC